MNMVKVRMTTPSAVSASKQPASLDRLRSRINLFWAGVTIATVLLGALQLANDHPHLATTRNGFITGILMLTFVAWCLVVMTKGREWRLRKHFVGGIPAGVPFMVVGTALAGGLIVLHDEFVGVAFVVIGISLGALRWPLCLIPQAIVTLLYIRAANLFDSSSATDFGYKLFSLVLTIGIVYTISSLYRQRAERERLFTELQEAHQRLRLATTREVELAALRERNRLARDMHDSIGRALVLIAIKIEAAQRLQSVQPERAASEWEETKALVRSTMADLRTSLAGLRLPALDEQPFEEAVTELVIDTRRNASINVHSSIPEEANTLPRGTQEVFYRVAQEALTNVTKHARAENVWITLQLGAEAAALTVEDDGVGLNGGDQHRDGHYGITGMRERVEALGGLFSLAPRPDGGTIVRARVPLTEEADVRYPTPVS